MIIVCPINPVALVVECPNFCLPPDAECRHTAPWNAGSLACNAGPYSMGSHCPAYSSNHGMQVVAAFHGEWQSACILRPAAGKKSDTWGPVYTRFIRNYICHMKYYIRPITHYICHITHYIHTMTYYIRHMTYDIRPITNYLFYNELFLSNNAI